MIKGIVAAGKNWEIGKKNGLLFKLKEDMKVFTGSTKHHIVAMGENTLLSFPGSKPLKERVNIVLCPEGHEYDDCICIHNFNVFVNYIKILSKEYDVWIIGGGMLYKSMLSYYDEVVVNKVDAEDKEATVFFPNLDEDPNFELYLQCQEVEDNDYKTRLCFYRRVNQTV